MSLLYTFFFIGDFEPDLPLSAADFDLFF